MWWSIFAVSGWAVFRVLREEVQLKITIAYLTEEEKEAAASVAALRQLHPGAKIRKSEAHPPFKHIYLTTKKPGKP